MSIKIYKDASANSIFIEDANGAQFLNSLQASVPVDKVTITDLARGIDIVSDAVHTDFIDENDNPYTGTAIDVCNTLNSIFSSSGTPTSELPNITSTLTINSVQGSIINYELTADYGVGYEWDLSNVAGITTVEGNVRKIIGGSSLASGTYNIPVKAINYNGEDSETIVLTVSTPPFANTKSIKFSNQDYLGANASQVSSVLGRTGNGSGSSDAWTIAMWVKPEGTQNNQTLFFYGGNDLNNEGNIWIRYYGGSSLQTIRLQYGSENNRLTFIPPDESFPRGQWTHLMITYDGGTTGSSSSDMNDYYSRFNIYSNGVLQTNSNGHSNYGFSGGINDDLFQIGREGNATSYIRSGGKVDEIAIWGSNQSSNVSDIYNSGETHNLDLLTEPPSNWWRMGDGDTYPYLQDSGTEANCIFQMYNMTAADIVNDVP